MMRRGGGEIEGIRGEGKEALFFVCGIKAQSKEVKLILTQRERERERWEREKERKKESKGKFRCLDKRKKRRFL